MANSGTINGDDDRIEATRLSSLNSLTHLRNDGGENVSSQATERPKGVQKAWKEVQHFWGQHVNPVVPHESCRDHFANERTFLAYFRTSLALSFFSVLIAQLFRIQHRASPDLHFGYYVIGKPLASVCICGSIVVISVGAYRSWRQQNAMLRGKVHAGGWGLIVVGLTIGLITFATLILVVTAASRRDEGN